MKYPESVYRNPAAMEPLLPGSGRKELSHLSVEIFKKSGELKASLPSPITRAAVAEIVRNMNSYYSNLIEGHKTLPGEIDRALKQDFSQKEDCRRNQKLSVAHIQAEKAMREVLVKSPETNVFSADFIRYLHHEFYSHISQEEWVSFSHDGQKYPITPGAFRDHPVSVGSHVPPDHEKLNLFLQRFESEYSSGRIYETNKLIAIAASHHRLAWIHPFADGNGRVIRLQSQAALIQSGVDADGLWTLSRSLARNKEDYYRLLQNADQGRRNDLDGRGNLSDKALLEFCTFFLEQALDQIEFMMGLLAPNELLGRIERYFKVEYAECEDKDRERLARLISELCLKGEIPRGDVPAIIGLKDSAAREIIRHALEDEIIVSPSPKGILQINFPLKVRETFFPRLFTDLSAN